MANTGFVITGTGANNADAGNTAWSNPGNVTADDGTNATSLIAVIGQSTQYLHATNFGFAIPDGATIDGIQVRVQKVGTPSNRGIDHTIQLIVGGSRAGDNKADTVTTWPYPTPANVDYGGTADLWSNSLSPTTVNGSDFGVAVRAQENGAGAVACAVDAIWIAVEYTEGGGTTVGLMLLGAGA